MFLFIFSMVITYFIACHQLSINIIFQSYFALHVYETINQCVIKCILICINISYKLNFPWKNVCIKSSNNKNNINLSFNITSIILKIYFCCLFIKKSCFLLELEEYVNFYIRSDTLYLCV